MGVSLHSLELQCQTSVVDGDTWRGTVGPLYAVNGSVETQWTVCKFRGGGMRKFCMLRHFLREPSW